MDHPRTYLASIVDIPLKPGERFSAFSISTWGVTFNAVCHVPYGWTIKAGGDATPEGVLEGSANQGTTWLGQKSSGELRDLVLVTLYGSVQRQDIAIKSGVVPATFKGHAYIEVDDGRRRVNLTFSNVSLRPSTHCPVAAP
jgi:hypothetical protein